jgi:hypothetical protein
VEAIITQLIFEHSLRIRVNSHVAKSNELKADTSMTTPDVASSAASIAEGDGGSDEGTIPVSESQISGSTAVEPTEDAEPLGKAKKTTDTAQKVEDQTGKIMTMVTADLKTLQSAADWLSPCKYFNRCQAVSFTNELR